MATKVSKGKFADNKGRSVSVTTTVTAPSPGVDPGFEKPLVTVTVNNPFKKILYWLNQIRKHQTTTLAIKFSIPLIALPIIIAAAFSLGRVSGLNFYIKASPPIIPSPGISGSNQTSISKAGILKVAKSPTVITYLLSLRNGEIMSLEVPSAIDLTKYANKQILVTGSLDKSTNILKVIDIAEITIFNTTVVPESTESANP